jgi:hypothetical protein
MAQQKTAKYGLADKTTGAMLSRYLLTKNMVLQTQRQEHCLADTLAAVR